MKPDIIKWIYGELTSVNLKKRKSIKDIRQINKFAARKPLKSESSEKYYSIKIKFKINLLRTELLVNVLRKLVYLDDCNIKNTCDDCLQLIFIK